MPSGESPQQPDVKVDPEAAKRAKVYIASMKILYITMLILIDMLIIFCKQLTRSDEGFGSGLNKRAQNINKKLKEVKKRREVRMSRFG